MARMRILCSMARCWRRTPALALVIVLSLGGCQRAEAPRTAPLPQVTEATVVQQADALLALHRKVLVLMADLREADEAQRLQAQAIGMQWFHQQRGLQQQLAEAVLRPGSEVALDALLTRIESEPTWFDADRLAFKELLQHLAQEQRGSQQLTGIQRAKRIQDDLAALAEVEQTYAAELGAVMGRLETRGIELKRERWDDYVAKLRALYPREQLLRDPAALLAPEVLAPLPGGSAPALRGPAPERELFGAQLPPKTLLLSFDDGPHGRYTDQILEILQRHQAPAVFFQLGQNLGKVDAEGKVSPGPGLKVAQRVLAAGHQLANHSFSHGLMSKFEPPKVRQEAAATEALLNAAGRQGDALFRFPYGARTEAGLSAVEALKLRSMMWNVDSLDWADPIPKSIAARVLAELKKRQRGIVLFHDIHARTVEALPLVLEQLQADGWRFARWQGGQFVVSDPAAKAPALSGNSGYRDSHALVIGIDDYAQWPKLAHAKRDAQAVADTLKQQFGFKAENVELLLDGQATRAAILRALNQRLADAKRVQRDDRVFVFFAGHGSTRRLPSGREVGYIVPVDAGPDDLQGGAISMPQLQEVAEAISAKHALLVIDACYSGLGLTRAGGNAASQNFVRDNARRVARQMMTAGGADQQVADDGPGGHSVFTWTLLQALGGKGDLNGDGLITGTELAAYVAPAVAAIAQQTPAFGSLPGSQGGEFVFALRAPDAAEQTLSGDSRQLDAQASALAQKVDRLRSAPVAGAASAVEVAVAGLDGKPQALSTPAEAPALSPRQAAQRAHDRGLQLYRERRYAEAEAAFLQALSLQPRFSLAANNLGFLFYKQGQAAKAVPWFEQAVDADPARALAWLNLGDARLLMGDEALAEAAYQRYLALTPQHSRAAEVRAWLAGGPKPKPPV